MGRLFDDKTGEVKSRPVKSGRLFSEPVIKQKTLAGKIIQGTGKLIKGEIERAGTTLLAKPAVRTTELLTRTLAPKSMAAKGFEIAANEGNGLNVGNINIPTIKSGKEGIRQIAGEGLETASYLLPYGRISKGITGAAFAGRNAPAITNTVARNIRTIGNVGAGITGGYTADVGLGLQDETKTIPEALTPGVGTVIGAAIPLVGRLFGKARPTVTPKERINPETVIPEKISPEIPIQKIETTPRGRISAQPEIQSEISPEIKQRQTKILEDVPEFNQTTRDQQIELFNKQKEFGHDKIMDVISGKDNTTGLNKQAAFRLYADELDNAFGAGDKTAKAKIDELSRYTGGTVSQSGQNLSLLNVGEKGNLAETINDIRNIKTKLAGKTEQTIEKETKELFETLKTRIQSKTKIPLSKQEITKILDDLTCK